MRRALGLALRALGAGLLGLLLLEGAASLLHVAGRAAAGAPAPLAERLHTKYDPELGWVNAPGVRAPAHYGPGVSLSTNARGFRGVREVEDRAPQGVFRIVCSGDSFTLGYGVGDDETWCARLESLVPGSETINMGQGGYGIDQAYLWFRRDGRSLAPRLHLFAVIHEDFLRMESDRFLGYGKPVLEVVDGRIVPRNVPVPPGAFEAPVAARWLPVLEELRAFAALRDLRDRVAPAPSGRRPNDDVLSLAVRVFEETRSQGAARGGELVVVYLPMREDGTEMPGVDAFRETFVRDATARGLRVIDLIPAFRTLPESERRGLFLARGALDYPAAEGHYTAAGNERVARLLAERLAAAGLVPAPSASPALPGAGATPGTPD